MRGFTARLKKGRFALVALGVLSAIVGTTIATATPAHAEHRGEYRDRDDRGWDRGRDNRGWERERWDRIREQRWREERWREARWRQRHWNQGYYAPPAYYDPPAAYYAEPGVSLGFSFR